MSVPLNRRLVLAERPVGVPLPRHFRRDDVPARAPAEGEFFVRNRLLSVDPAQRGWVNAGSNYSAPVPIGEVMRSLALAEIVESRAPGFAVGELLYGWFGWQDYCVAGAAQVLRRVDPAQASDTEAIGVLGITGLTAYLALTQIGAPREGETVMVSTAAGAVGSIVGQIARRLGCRVVGLTGGDDKLRLCMEEFGYHAALNYRRGLTREALAAACPQGIDIFFDNTSGAIADAVWPHLNLRARVIQCGTAAEAVWDPVPLGPRRDRDILTKRVRHEGFIIFDHVAQYPAVAEILSGWLREGALRVREDVVEGLDAAPAALEGLYRGENLGKKIVRL